MGWPHIKLSESGLISQSALQLPSGHHTQALNKRPEAGHRATEINTHTRNRRFVPAFRALPPARETHPAMFGFALGQRAVLLGRPGCPAGKVRPDAKPCRYCEEKKKGKQTSRRSIAKWGHG